MRIRLLYSLFIFYFLLSAIRLPAQKRSMLYRPFRTHLQKGTIKEFLDEINAVSGVQIEYASVSFQDSRIISPASETLTLGALLQQVLSGEKVKAIEKNDKIILVPSTLPLAGDALLPRYSFFGMVGEEGSREPLHDAVIYEPATHRAAITNAYGYFSMLLPEGRHQLEISYAGYATRRLEVELHWDLRNDISMPRKEYIPEVIVTAGDGIKKNAIDKILPGQYDAYNNFSEKMTHCARSSFFPA